MLRRRRGLPGKAEPGLPRGRPEGLNVLEGISDTSLYPEILPVETRLRGEAEARDSSERDEGEITLSIYGRWERVRAWFSDLLWGHARGTVRELELQQQVEVLLARVEDLTEARRQYSTETKELRAELSIAEKESEGLMALVEMQRAQIKAETAIQSRVTADATVARQRL